MLLFSVVLSCILSTQEISQTVSSRNEDLPPSYEEAMGLNCPSCSEAPRCINIDNTESRSIYSLPRGSKDRWITIYDIIKVLTASVFLLICTILAIIGFLFNKLYLIGSFVFMILVIVCVHEF
ncbi:hypothetical protein NGRA_2297 [Nosema granulosis]|uniref:Uncharacterized protein n=1 Tax=Nosema granulosis TaxID=83296 RepID=A0A9P6GWW5_9MICR|nr:hypothetical protein NGRA_2297 [Nosema granulosis]